MEAQEGRGVGAAVAVEVLRGYRNAEWTEWERWLKRTRWPDWVAGEGWKHHRDLRSAGQTLFECHPPFQSRWPSPSVQGRASSSPLVSRVNSYSFPSSTVDRGLLPAVLTAPRPCFLFPEGTASARREENRQWTRVAGNAGGAVQAPSL